VSGFSVMSKEPSIIWAADRLINKRIDSNYYHIKYIEYLDTIVNCGLDCKPFEDICKRMNSGPFGSALLASAYVEKGVPFIRPLNCKNFIVEDNELVFISNEDSIRLKSSRFNSGALIITKIGNGIGDVAIIPRKNDKCNISGNLMGVEIKNSYDNYFVLSFLKSKYGQNQIWQGMMNSAKPKIDMDTIRSIQIPIPSAEIQKYIGDKVRRAEELREEAKRLKEEAELVLKEQLLLDKTESLYNNNAGNPSLEFNKYPIKIFVNPSDITTRLDAKSYHPEFYETLNYLQNNNFRTKVLKDMLEDYGTGISSPRYADSGTKILMTKNLKNDTIDLDCKRVDAKIDPKMRVNVEDVLVTTYGGPSIGKVDIFTSNEECVFDYTILKMRFTKDYNPYFMTLLLRSKLIQNQMRNLIKGTTGITFIIPTEILDIQIPIIEKSIQDEIGMLYQHSLKCIEIGKQLIQQAKQDVEDLIEGKFDTSKLNNDSSTESRC